MTRPTSPSLPLAEASRRLRRPPGRPRKPLVQASPGPLPTGTSGSAVQRAAPGPAPDAGKTSHFATTLLPRALPIRATITKAKDGKPAVTTYPATAYSGIPVRTLLRLIEAGRLRPIRVPGMGRLLLDRHDLDALLEAAKEPA